jgi:hypothetical protein
MINGYVRFMKLFDAHHPDPSSRKALRTVIRLLMSVIAIAPIASQPASRPLLPGPGDSWRWVVRYGAVSLASAVLSGRGEAGSFILDLATDPRLPMARIRNTYEYRIDPFTLAPITYTNSSSWGKDVKRISYSYDFEAGNILYEGDFTEKGGSVRKSGSIAMDEGVLDGLSLILRIMSRAGKAGSERACFIGEASAVPVDMVYGDAIESVRLRGTVAPVAAYRIEGRLAGKGVAGLFGAFTAWIRAEAPNIPVKASFKIWLGSVTVEFAPGQDALVWSEE